MQAGSCVPPQQLQPVVFHPSSCNQLYSTAAAILLQMAEQRWQMLSVKPIPPPQTTLFSHQRNRRYITCQFPQIWQEASPFSIRPPDHFLNSNNFQSDLTTISSISTHLIFFLIHRTSPILFCDKQCILDCLWSTMLEYPRAAAAAGQCSVTAPP